MPEHLHQRVAVLESKIDEISLQVADHRDFLSRSEGMITRLVEISEKNQSQIASLVEETRGFVELYKDLQGVGRVGARVQKAMFWFAKWPVIGAAVFWLAKWLEARGLLPPVI